MKRIITYVVLITSLIGLNLFNLVEVSATKEDLRLWVITDVHHLSPSLYEEGPRIQQMQETGAGLDLFYSPERLQALVYQINQAADKPDALIVSGDLTLNGEYESVIELRDVFQRFEDMGVAVYVIPGNHDIYNGWSRSFSSTDSNRTRQVTAQEFEQLMNEFGYADALSKDQASLSYVNELSQDHWLIMLDTNIYSEVNSQEAPISNGRLSEGTLKWLENILIESVHEYVNVTIVLHHNSIRHFDGFGSQFAVENSDELITLLEKYAVQLTLSGHIHAQHIGQYTNDQGEVALTDIATGAFSVQPSVIGELILNNNSGEYKQIQLDVEGWANDTNQDDTNLLNYSTYIQSVFKKANERINEDASLSSDLLNELNAAFFAGTIAQDWDEINTRYNINSESSSLANAGFMSEYLELLLEQKERNHLEYEWEYD